MKVECAICHDEIREGQKFVRLRHPDRTIKNMQVAHADTKCAGDVGEKVRVMSPKYSEAIAGY
jgi:hypothetical protein